MYDEADFLLLSGLQHFAFCRRQWALIHIEQAWQENILTIEGKFLHETTHDASREKRGDVIITRSMPVFSRELGITGVCDVVELRRDKDGIAIHGSEGKYRVVPIEYKRGKPKEHNADELQACAQALCLEEMFACGIDEALLFYGETRRRHPVALTAEIRQTVRDMLKEMHGYHQRGYTPRSRPTKACKACSLANLCLPTILKSTSVKEFIRANTGEADE